ncbi:MAG TPA: cyclic nucleotide-binding domain-containing protein [Kofleriaceae bacterium]|nr:cyclic nucleotide-binding domain-containing protein [Kofleriaceae bacterium]
MARLERLLTKARAAAEKGKRDKALELYRDACSEAQHDPDLWLERAELERKSGATAAAAESLFHAADLYARAGMAGEAAGIAEKVLALDPKHGGARRFARMLASRAPAPAAVDPDEAAPVIEMVAAEPEPQEASPPPPVTPDPSPATPEPSPPTREPLIAPPPEPETVSPRALHALQADAVPEERPIGRVTGQIALGEISFAAALANTPVEVALDDETSMKMVRAVAATISTSPLLSELDSDLVRYLIEGGSLVHVPAGRAVFQEGELGDSLFLVLEGTVDVERHDPASGAIGRLATLRKGAFFGEMALLTDTPRSATVRVTRDATLLEVSREAVRTMIGRDERVLKLLMRFFRARLVGTLMATSPLFTHLGADERRDLVTRFRLRELPSGHPVLAQNTPGDGLYMVLAGELVAVRGDVGPEDEQELGRLHPGDVFGEMSLLEDRPAMATVRTATRSWVLRLPREEFERLARAHPQVRNRLIDIATQRREANRARIASIEPV